MKSYIKVGIVVGVISACPSTFVTAFTCGMAPILLLFVGGVAGYLTSIQEKSTERDRRAAAGDIAAGIAGGISSATIVVFWSVLTGSRGLAALNQSAEAFISDPSTLVAKAIGVGAVCLFLLTFAVAAGAISGYLVNPAQTSTPTDERGVS